MVASITARPLAATGDGELCLVEMGSIMPIAYFPGDRLPKSIERPRCVHCTVRMMLTEISSGLVGYEHRRFQCIRCKYVENKVVANDPMKSASGWLAGELRAPN
jgi:hypothetical protein